MPFKSQAQRKFFNVPANRKRLESQGVDVDHWNKSSKGKRVPERVKKASLLDQIIQKAVAHSKQAAAKWRLPENLLKAVRRIEQTTGNSLAKQTSNYNRHQVLQTVSDTMGLGKEIGKDYAKVVDSLNWRKVPDVFKKQIASVGNDAAEPRFLFRGIRPGKNIEAPFQFDNINQPAKFVHATPHAGVATPDLYAKPFGNTNTRAVQVFKANKDQPYFQDFDAVHFVNNRPGAAPGLDWAAKREQILKLMQVRMPSAFSRNLFTGERTLKPKLWFPSAQRYRDSQMQLLTRFETYETPMSMTATGPTNKFLGNFLIRTAPRDPAVKYTIDAGRKHMFNTAEYAKIPKNLEHKVSRMGVQQSERLPGIGQPLTNSNLKLTQGV